MLATTYAHWQLSGLTKKLSASILSLLSLKLIFVIFRLFTQWRKG